MSTETQRRSGGETHRPDIGTRSFATIIFLLLLTAVLTAKEGADATAYFYWHQYFSSFDLGILAGLPKSPTGLPFIQHQYGIGLLAAIPDILFGMRPSGMLLTGAFLGLASMVMLILVVRTYTASREELLFWIAGSLLFTPAVFYLNAYSTEGWTIFLTLAGLCCVEWLRRHPTHPGACAATLGIVCYFLLLVRTTNIIVCGALAMIFCWDLLGRRLPDTGFAGTAARVLAGLAFPPALAIAFLATFNHFVNGSFLASPYTFGDGAYASLSLSHAKFVEVLFSSWHGLALYHPLMLAAVVWLAVVSNRNVAAVAAIVAFALQLAIQGSWYGWWMGRGTFGARAFCGIGVLIVYALLRGDRRPALPPPFRMAVVVALSIVATLEAYLTSRGVTNYIDYASLARDLLSRKGMILILLYAALSCSIFLGGRWIGLDLSRRLLAYMIAVFVFSFVPVFSYAEAAIKVGIAVLCVGLFAAGWPVLTAPRVGAAVQNMRDRATNYAPVLSVIVVSVALATSVYAQIKMFGNFSEQSGPASADMPKFLCDEVIATRREYDLIAGYDRDKADLSAFLERSKCSRQRGS